MFTWPGYDLRPIEEQGGRIDYGFLSPKLFDQMVSKFENLYREGRVERMARDE